MVSFIFGPRAGFDSVTYLVRLTRKSHFSPEFLPLIRNVVYRSEHVENHLNPYWTPLTLGLEKICFCDLDWPIKITIKDHQHNGEHRVIGNFETTTRELLERVAIRGNADRETAFEIFGETSASTQITRGLIVVTVAELLLEQQ